ncbi:DNA replication and repair protein RecF [Marinomonas gallaica]|uniref:DNA replication and repair protein RecF n=1 Tax=Marinomonas gallaica TaxID=1806667 RepID=A0A1C3JRA5_9GAMM|nr:AAA family ATPase [Marinomonas gallaica]SBT17702.1 DNA replication and repair protein RecF [Marinomonas gallaica]SBT20028.1 DNA replication and repair protein RecF [Marinomonas gallaica]
MHLSKVALRNYRNFSNAKFVFSKGINTIIGENGSGKTNLFRAIRLLLDDSMKRSALRLEERDFCRGLGDWRGHWVIISLEFDEVSMDEAIQALFLHGTGDIDDDEQIERSTYNLIFRPNQEVRGRLAQLDDGDSDGLASLRSLITIDDYEVVITGRSFADFNDNQVYTSIVGDFENVIFPTEFNPAEIGARIPPILSISKEISFTFAQALRDVVSEFHNNRTNPLLALLRHKSSEINQAEFQPIVDQVGSLNSSIENLSDVSEVRNDIKQTVNDTVGDAFSPTALSIKSDLSDEADKLFQSLKLFVAETDDGYEGAIHEMSLGGANLIYLTLKLLEFKYQTRNQPIANFLLIEEPEAHIHTHIQKSLFEKISYPNTQVIYSTHSSHISEASKIRNVNVIGKVDGRYEAFQPSTGLTPKQIIGVERYLDAVRSNLLFAKSVLLVEGDAEEILIPIFVNKALGLSLDELGVSLVNIRSTGFENIALLFHDDRISKKCSIITDLDSPFFDTNIIATDTEAEKNYKQSAIRSSHSGATRKVKFDAFCNNNAWIKPCYATHTFEVDLLLSKNNQMFVSAINDVYSDAATINTAKQELLSDDISISGKRSLTMANSSGKGWFAITLGQYVTHNINIPDYIWDAIVFSHQNFNDDILEKILSYRIKCIEEDLIIWREMVDTTTEQAPNWYADWNNYIQPRADALPNLKQQFESFQLGLSEIPDILQVLETSFPDNPIISLLRRI